VQIVVLTGAAPAFSAGFDLGEFQDAKLARTIRHSSVR
jgi:enoyl-CoA hydratase/carnithine racemase